MKNHQLQHRLLKYFIFVAIVPAVCIALLYFGITQADTRARLEQDYNQRLTHAMNKIENKVTQINEFTGWIFRQNDLQILLARPETQVSCYDEAFHQAVQELRSQFSYRPVTRDILSLFLIGDNGVDIRAGSEASLIDPQDLTDLITCSDACDTYWGCLTANLTAFTDHPQVLFYRHPMIDPDTGVQTGWLVLLFSSDLFREECADLLTDAENQVMLFNQNDGTLACFGSQRSQETRLEGNVESLPTGWALSVQMSTAALGEQRRTALWMTGMIFLVALIMTAILAWMLSRSLARPVERMMQTVTRISQGDFSRNHPVMLGGASEMDTLERHIGDMGDSMERLLHTQLEREQEKRALEIRMLQNQLNPHFLYNTLNTIKLMAALQGKTAIQNMIEALGRLLRANLSAGEEQIRLSQELDMLDSYLYIQNTAKKGVLHLVKEISEPDVLEYLVPKFLLQPVVENAIVHGLVQNPLGETITLSIQAVGHTLHLIVSDTGQGMTLDTLDALRHRIRAVEPPRTDGKHGFGLWSTAARLRLQYDDKADISIDSQEGQGTTVHIWLPVQRERRTQDAKQG